MINMLPKFMITNEEDINKIIKLAYTDTMTGCYNRNLLEEYRTIFDSQKLYVSIVDIDGLKQVNDTIGHEYGDLLIKSVAEDLKTIADGSTIVIRLGGDEFLVLSDECLIVGIENASIGTVYKSTRTSLKLAMKEADEVMYAMKKIKKSGV